MELARKKKMILEHELRFAAAVASAAIEKPKASFWIILLPFMFIFLIHDMLKFKRSRIQFIEEFMADRRCALTAAFEATFSGSTPVIDQMVSKYDHVETLKKTYAAWIGVMVDHYMDLLTATGDNLEELVRSAYRRRTDYLLILNRLNMVEKEFFEALANWMQHIKEASCIMAAVQNKSNRLRRSFAEQVFP